MSRTVIGYEGEGKHRRPIFDLADDVELPINPPGPVERRQANAGERGGFTPRIQAVGLVRLPRRSTTALVEAVIHPEHFGDPDRWRQPLESVTPPEEEPAMEPVAVATQSIVESRSATSRLELLRSVHVAALEATEALEALTAAQMRLEVAELALAVAVLALDGRSLPVEAVGDLAPDRAGSADVRNGDHFAAAPASTESLADIPEPGPGPRAKLESGLTRRQEEVLTVVRRHRGDRAKAAAELNVRYQSVNTVLEAIGKAGKLPTDLIAQLPASFAKYSGV